MASLGQTADMVAHEVSNPLAFASSTMFVLRREVAVLLKLLDLYRRAEEVLVEPRRKLHALTRNLSEQVDLPCTLDNLDRSCVGLKRIQKIMDDLRDFAQVDIADYQDADLNVAIAAYISLMRGRGSGGAPWNRTLVRSCG